MKWREQASSVTTSKNTFAFTVEGHDGTFSEKKASSACDPPNIPTLLLSFNGPSAE